MTKKPTVQAVEDDVYPNDGAAFLPSEPSEQVNERNTEKAQLFEALPLVEEIVKDFQAQIDLLKSIDAIPKEVRLDSDKFMHTVSANDIAVKFLINRKEYLEGLLEDYAR